MDNLVTQLGIGGCFVVLVLNLIFKFLAKQQEGFKLAAVGKSGSGKSNGNISTIDPKVMAAAIGNVVAAHLNSQLLQPVHDHISRSATEMKEEVKDCEKVIGREVELVQDHLGRTEPIYRDAAESARIVRESVSALNVKLDAFITNQGRIADVLVDNGKLLNKILQNGHGNG